MAKEQSDAVILIGTPLISERRCGEDLFPGSLLTFNSNGEYIKNTFAKLGQGVKVANVSRIQGRTIKDEYSDGDFISGASLYAGCVAQVEVAPGSPAIAVGDRLETTGTGGVQKLTDGVAVGQALSGVDNSGSAERALVEMEVL